MPNIHFYLANALAGGKASEAAVEEYRKALEETPGDGGIWHNLGVTFGALRKARRGHRPLQKAVELQPGNGEYRHDLALALLGQGKTAEAVEQLQQAVALVPSEAVYRATSGSAHHGGRQYRRGPGGLPPAGCGPAERYRGPELPGGWAAEKGKAG